jgi:exopolysaccharide production protein ExoQ
MAVHAKHAASAPPSAPVREKTGHLLLRAYCILLLLTALTGSAWNNLLGPVGLAAYLALLAIVTVLLWLRPPLAEGEERSRFPWRRLPRFVLLYVAWAAASLLWSAWPQTSATTWFVLATTTLQGLFVASVLTWDELVRAIASAMKWALGLSIAFELFVSLIVHGPLLPFFVDPPGKIPPELYWSRDNLFDGGRIQGIVGNSNLLGMLAALALVVFSIRLASRTTRRGWLIAWMVLAVFLLYRAGSATAVLTLVAAAVVLGTVLLMRTARRPGARTKWYLSYAVIAVGGSLAVWFLRGWIFEALGRSADLTGREEIWAAVLDKASQHPVVGWGFATPWLPWDPAFDNWIVDHGLTVFHAHNMWIDVFFQVGAIGLALMIVVYLSFIWRAWFFAVDRPRWDLRADRPYSAVTLLPTLVITILLVQGVSESRPLMEWGWMFVVMLGFKMKVSPLVGVGPAEQRLAIERGEPTKQVQ